MVASALYGFADEPSGLPGILGLTAAYLFPAGIALWVRIDAARRRSRVPYDFDSFIFFLWPLAAPVYLFRTRGWRAFGPIVFFVASSIVVVLFEGLLLSLQLSRS